MINPLLVFDEKDIELGNFFAQCQKDLISFFEQNNIQTEIINSQALNDIMLELKLQISENQNFIFAAYSHGTEDSLLKSGQTSYLSVKNEFIKSFKNSFFYTFSCLTGVILGNKLIEKGSFCFIGYEKKVGIYSLNDTDTELQPFVNCANYGLKLFYEGENTINIIEKMKEKYNDCIDNTVNMFVAEQLMTNRDALVLLGENISIGDLK